MTFDYEKADGKKSQRAIVTRFNGSPNIHGIDISELDSDQLVDFIEAYKALEAQHNAEIVELMIEHDLKHSFRQFKPTGITNQRIEKL